MIVLGQLAGGVRAESARARKAGEADRRRGPSDLGMLGAVLELEGLDEELHVHEATAAELHVQAARRLLAELELHPRSHLRDLLQPLRTERRAERVPADHRTNASGQAGVAPADPGAREGLALPEVPVLGIVPLRSGHARGEAAALAARTKPKIDRESDAGGGDVTKVAGQSLDGFAPERVGFDALGAIALSVLVAVGGEAVRRTSRRFNSSIREEDIEVRARRELAPPELTEADDHCGNEAAVGGARHTMAVDQWLKREQHPGGQRGLG